MREGRDFRNYETDSIEKNLVSTRYSVLDEMISVKESLDKEALLLQDKKIKAEEMKRKILMLEAAEKKSKRVANSYKKKLEKLEVSQNMVQMMYVQKGEQIDKREKELEEKKRRCLMMKEDLAERREKSQQFLERQTSMRVKRIKEHNFSAYLQWQRRSQADFSYRKEKKQNIKQQQLQARSRLQRYEQFKLARAQYNYDSKKQQEIEKHAEKLRQLQSLKNRALQQNQIFRKTQILEKEANQFQSFYLTNQG